MYRLPDIPDPLDFPDDFETTEDGLLAMGGNLHPVTLIHAYAKGLFPWFSKGDPILWWHPDPRLVIFPDKVRVTSKMRKILKKVKIVPSWDKSAFGMDCRYQVTFNTAFRQVMTECANKRGKARRGTWIQKPFLASYSTLHEHGYAQSAEVWNSEGRLVGGIYGVTIGGIFFGESMFSHEDNASKMALISLCQRLIETGYLLIDGQVSSPHLFSVGGVEIPRQEFLKILKKAKTNARTPGPRLEK